MYSRGTVKRASMVPPRDIMAVAGCERKVEDDFLAGEIVRPREYIPPPPAVLSNANLDNRKGVSAALCRT